MTSAVGIFGGTFDPLHFGHIRTVTSIREQLNLERVLVIPAGKPPHRQNPITLPEHRLAMVQQVFDDMPGFECDDRDIRREGAAYTVLTLTELRQELGDLPLYLILGLDSFLGLPTWHRWTEILENAHIVAMHRAGWEPPSLLPDWCLAALQTHPDSLRQQSAGFLYFAPVPVIELGSTYIREQLSKAADVSNAVPAKVLEYIRAHHLYV